MQSDTHLMLIKSIYIENALSSVLVSFQLTYNPADFSHDISLHEQTNIKIASNSERKPAFHESHDFFSSIKLPVYYFNIYVERFEGYEDPDCIYGGIAFLPQILNNGNIGNYSVAHLLYRYTFIIVNLITEVNHKNPENIM